MNPSFEDFERQALADGYDQVLARDWPALAVLDTHTHPFAVRAVVVQGELWLTVMQAAPGAPADHPAPPLVERETLHLREGDCFELPHSAPHAERYGPQGATYWVARRNAA